MKAMRLVPEGDGFSLSPGLRADPAKVAEMLRPSPMLELVWAAREVADAASVCASMNDPETPTLSRASKEVLRRSLAKFDRAREALSDG